MSIESDLEAFRDLALERQIKIQSSIAPRTEILSSVYGDLDPLLAEIIGETPVLVSGTVFNAHRFPEGFNINPNHIKPLVYGDSKGLLVADRSIIHPELEITPEALIIGFLVSQTNDNYETEYHFAPIENSSISAPDLELYSAEHITPEAEDTIAENIDLCILNNRVDLLALNEIFNTAGLNELSIEFYIDYLNNTFKPIDYDLTFIGTGLLELTNEFEYIQLLESETVLLATCSPVKFIYSSSFEGLCIVFQSEERDGIFLLPAVSLHEAEFTSKL